MSALSRDGRQHRRERGSRRGRREPEDDAGVDEVDGAGETFVVEKKKETVDRTDDPVRMYLREMGAVELLSREGEIAIAKRIEAGRDTMIWGLCESPITFNAIIEWSNALNNGHDAAARDPRSRGDALQGPDRRAGRRRRGRRRHHLREHRRPLLQGGRGGRGGRPRRRTRRTAMVERRAPRPVEEEDEDNTLCLAQMEETLKPAALEKFAAITGLYKKFARLQLHPDGGDERRPGIRAPPRRRNIRSCASSSPPRSRASSSTAPRSNISSTSSTATTAG